MTLVSQARASGFDSLEAVPSTPMDGQRVLCDSCATSIPNLHFRCPDPECGWDLCVRCHARGRKEGKARAGHAMGVGIHNAPYGGDSCPNDRAHGQIGPSLSIFPHTATGTLDTAEAVMNPAGAAPAASGVAPEPLSQLAVVDPPPPPSMMAHRFFDDARLEILRKAVGEFECQEPSSANCPELSAWATRISHMLAAKGGVSRSGAPLAASCGGPHGGGAAIAPIGSDGTGSAVRSSPTATGAAGSGVSPPRDREPSPAAVVVADHISQRSSGDPEVGFKKPHPCLVQSPCHYSSPPRLMSLPHHTFDSSPEEFKFTTASC